MPTHRTYQTMERHEQDVVAQLESLSVDGLHLWPNLNDFRVPDIDIFAVHERLGVFAIEMKSHNIECIDAFSSAQWRIRGEAAKTSPVCQAKKAMEAMVRRLKSEGAYSDFVAPIVLWSAIDRREWNEAFSDSPLNLALGQGMLFRDDIQGTAARFESALTGARAHAMVGSPVPVAPVTPEFTAYCIRAMSDGGPKRNIVLERDRLRHFEEKYRNEFQARVPVDVKTRLILEGAPGTGKTWALMAMARMHAEAGKSVLFLCYNKVLRADLSRMFEAFDQRALYNGLQIQNIFEFLDSIQDTHPIRGDGTDQWADLIANGLRTGDIEPPLYDLILVDEAQDMKDYVEPILDKAIAEGGSIVLGVGKGQELYPNTAEGSWLERFRSTEPPIHCENVYRTPEEIFYVAQAIRESNIREDRITPNVDKIVSGYCEIPKGRVRPVNRTNRLAFKWLDTMPVVATHPQFPKFVERVKVCIGQCADMMPMGEPRSSLVLLVPSSKSLWLPAIREALKQTGWKYIDYVDPSNRSKTAKKDQVRLITFHSSRGVEGNTVVLFDLGYMVTNSGGIAEKLLYIGLTRCLSRAFVVDIKGDESLPGKMLARLSDEVAEAMKCRPTDNYHYAGTEDPREHMTPSVRALASPLVESKTSGSPAGGQVRARIRDLILKWFR